MISNMVTYQGYNDIYENVNTEFIVDDEENLGSEFEIQSIMQGFLL